MSAPEEKLPIAVWSGEIMGVGAHVLDDGRRIIDAADLDRLFQRVATGEFDVAAAEEFARQYKAWMAGGTP